MPPTIIASLVAPVATIDAAPLLLGVLAIDGLLVLALSWHVLMSPAHRTAVRSRVSRLFARQTGLDSGAIS